MGGVTVATAVNKYAEITLHNNFAQDDVFRRVIDSAKKGVNQATNAVGLSDSQFSVPVAKVSGDSLAWDNVEIKNKDIKEVLELGLKCSVPVVIVSQISSNPLGVKDIILGIIGVLALQAMGGCYTYHHKPDSKFVAYVNGKNVESTSALKSFREDFYGTSEKRKKTAYNVALAINKYSPQLFAAGLTFYALIR